MQNAKRILALLLTLLLCLSCVTAAAAAQPEREAGETAANASILQRLERLLEQSDHEFSQDEMLRVIVVLEGAPKAELDSPVRSLGLARLKAQHQAFRGSLAKSGLADRLRFEYDTLLNGFALDLKPWELELLEELPGVRGAYIANEYGLPVTVDMESSNEMTGLTQIHESGYLGSGTVIAVLDTGITPEHEAFGVYSGMLQSPALSRSAVERQIQELGYGSFVSEKIPFAYDYADWDDDAQDDAHGHGTHVSGIAAGYARGEDGSLSFCGAAPDAQILALKVFSSYDFIATTDSSIYFKALEDACALGADVVNLSLGAPCGFTFDEDLEYSVYGNIFENLREQGVVVACAAGNRGSMADYYETRAGGGTVTAGYADYGNLDSPASYKGNVAVASVENVCLQATVLEQDGRLIRGIGLEDLRWEYNYTKEPVEYVAIPGYGRAEDFEGLQINNRVVLVQWGEISFGELARNAYDAGAMGILIYTDDPEQVDLYSDYNYDEPVAVISREDGEWLLAHTQTQAPPELPELPEPISDSEEDLGNAFVQVYSDSEFRQHEYYLLVNKQAERALDPLVQPLDQPGNSLPVTVYDWIIPASDALWNKMLQNKDGLLKFDGDLLCCDGEEGIQFGGDDTQEDLYLSVNADGSAEITCGEFQLRYDSERDLFRFFSYDSGLWTEPASEVALYGLEKIEGLLPTQVGAFRFADQPEENPWGWQMSYFSSWGVTPDLELKPTITAVGGSVVSAEYNTQDQYCEMSGTSMSTPDYAGGLACVLQYLREKRPGLRGVAYDELARALLESSARILTDDVGRIYSTRRQGAGLMDVAAAVNARAVITQPVLSLGDSQSGSFHVQFSVMNLTDQTLSYEINAAALRDAVESLDFDGDGETDGDYNTLTSQNVSRMVELLGNRLLVVPAGETVPVDLTLRVKDSLRRSLERDFPNGAFLDGFIYLNEAESPCDGGESCPGKAMTDMPAPEHWAHPGIDFVLRNGLFSGTSATTFSPELPMTRSMLVTVLYAHAGKPEPQGSNPFVDLEPDAYYEKPVIWAAENNIVAGTGNGRFSPLAEITREQLATILFSYAKHCGMDTGVRAPLEGFPDLGEVSPYALEPMSWAVAVGVLSGTTGPDGSVRLSPWGSATREQVATMLMSFLRNCLEPSVLSSELHAAFTGFVGDWSAAPLTNAHDWRDVLRVMSWMRQNSPYEDGPSYEEEGSYWRDFADFDLDIDYSSVYAYTQDANQIGEYLYTMLGDHPNAVGAYDEDRASLSTVGGMDSLEIRPTLLRNARRLIMTVADADSGEIYDVWDSTYVRKSNSWLFGNSEFMFSALSIPEEARQDGAGLLVCFYGTPAFGEDTLDGIDYEDLAEQAGDKLIWSFGFSLDCALPEIRNLSYNPMSHRLSCEAFDSRYLAKLELIAQPELDVWGDPMEDPVTVWSENYADGLPGQSHSASISNVQPGNYILKAMDFAGNSVQTNLCLGDSSKLCQVRFLGGRWAQTGCDSYLVSRGASLHIPWFNGETCWGSFYGWIPEPLSEVLSYEQMAQSALWEELVYPGQDITVYDDIDYYPLVELPMEFEDNFSRLEQFHWFLPDYTGVWAFGAHPEWDNSSACFLNSRGESVSAELDLSDGWPYLNDPPAEFLFDLEKRDDGSYYIMNSEGQYLTVEDWELAFVDEPDARASWRIWYHPDMYRMIFENLNPEGDSLYLHYDYYEERINLTTWWGLDDYDAPLIPYAPPVESFGYITDDLSE